MKMSTWISDGVELVLRYVSPFLSDIGLLSNKFNIQLWLQIICCAISQTFRILEVLFQIGLFRELFFPSKENSIPSKNVSRTLHKIPTFKTHEGLPTYCGKFLHGISLLIFGFVLSGQ